MAKELLIIPGSHAEVTAIKHALQTGLIPSEFEALPRMHNSN